MEDCFDFSIPRKRGAATGLFYVEGHKSKENWEDENTIIIPGDQGFATLADATAKARGYFGHTEGLGLIVVYQQDAEGAKEGIKMIFRNDEGELEESGLFY
jgi:outer membrane protease